MKILPDQTTELVSKRNQTYKVTVKYVREVTNNDVGAKFNDLQRSMEVLKLQLVGQNFYDAVAKIPIRVYNLRLWPGYVTSIRQQENDKLLCAEISTKVRRHASNRCDLA